MAELLKLNVQERTKLGKGPNRRLRASGMVPGILYDGKGTNTPVKVELVPLQKAWSTVSNTQVFDLVVEKDGKSETLPALIWRLTHEPIKGFPEHVDFYGVDLDKDVRVTVPFELVGEAVGVKNGGILEQPRDGIDVICKPMAIPESIVIDISELDIMDAIHIEDVEFPEGVIPQFDENFSVASVIEAGPDIEEELEAAAAEAAEAEGLEGEEGEAEGEAEGEESEEGEDASE